MEIETLGSGRERKKHCYPIVPRVSVHWSPFDVGASRADKYRTWPEINCLCDFTWISAVSCNLIGLSIKVNRRIGPVVDRPSACPEIAGVKLWLANLHG